MVTSPQHIGALQNQPENTNNLLDTRYQVRISKLPDLAFNCQSVSIPSASLQVSKQETQFNPIYYPGQPVDHEPLSIRFIVDEELVLYKAIWNWFKECTPYTGFDGVESKIQDVFSQDLTVMILDSNQNLTHTFHFTNVFPIALGSLEFNSSNTEANPLLIEVRFQYTTYSFDKED